MDRPILICPPTPNFGGDAFPQDWGAGGHSGRYRDHPHCLAEQLPRGSDCQPRGEDAIISLGRYLTLNAARQTGKTTLFREAEMEAG